jgi:AmpD protein
VKSFFSKLASQFGIKKNLSGSSSIESKTFDKMPHKYPETIALSPQTNGPYVRKIEPKAIVMHDTEGNYSGSIDWTSRVNNPSTGQRLYASYHCIIARDGRRTITNRDDNRAYHAGTSSFKGMTSLNNFAIGVAFERSSYNEPLQAAAVESAIEYIVPLMKKWGISIDMVTDHRTIAPNRKKDLNPKEFAKFHEALKKHLK